MSEERKHGPHNVGSKLIWTASSGGKPFELEITEWNSGCDDSSEPQKVGVYMAVDSKGRGCFVRYREFQPDDNGHVIAVWVETNACTHETPGSHASLT